MSLHESRLETDLLLPPVDRVIARIDTAHSRRLQDIKTAKANGVEVNKLMRALSSHQLIVELGSYTDELMGRFFRSVDLSGIPAKNRKWGELLGRLEIPDFEFFYQNGEVATYLYDDYVGDHYQFMHLSPGHITEVINEMDAGYMHPDSEFMDYLSMLHPTDIAKRFKSQIRHAQSKGRIRP